VKRVLGALAVAALLAARAAEGGPWAQGARNAYTKVSFQHLQAMRYAQPDGTVFDIPRFRSSELSFFGSFGLTDRLTLWVNVPLVRSSDLADDPDELGRENGFGDLGFALQAQLGARGPWVFAVRGSLQIPTGDEMRSEGLQATGSGVYESAGVLGAGRSFAGGRGFGFAEAGYKYRGGGLRDALVYAAQVGWKAGRRATLVWNVRGEEPFSHAPGTAALNSFVGVGDRVTYVVYGPSVILDFGRGWGAQLDLEGSFHAKNLAQGPMFRGGITYHR
jgi:hypothetical protein